MDTLKVEIQVPQAESVSINSDELNVELRDGRYISVPLALFPRLVHATLEERENWRLIAGGHGIHWEQLDEDISIEGLIAGRGSQESQVSLKKWLDMRSPAISDA